MMDTFQKMQQTNSFFSIFNQVINIATTIFIGISTLSNNIIQSETVQTMGLNLIYIYGNVAVKVEHLFKRFYENSYIFKVVIDTFQWLQEHYDIICSTRRKEPNEDMWMSLCSLNLVDNNFNYSEMYELLLTPITEELCMSFVNGSSSINTSCKNDRIVIVKTNYLYQVRLINNVDEMSDVNKSITPETMKQSPYRILSINYNHPKMLDAIELVVDPGMLVVGNEILSPVFVLRCLEYQENPFIFDMDYTLTIIDSEADLFKMNSQSFMYIGVDKPIICKRLYT